MNPVAFATRKVGDFLLLVGSLEVEPPHIRTGVDREPGDFDLVRSAGDLLEDGVFPVEVVPVLIDVGQVH